MKHYSKLFTSLSAVAFFVAVASVSLAHGQAPQQPSTSAESPQRGAGGDPIRQLNLSPEQREQVRMIRQQTNVERAAINQRLGESNRALEMALDSDNPDEAAVEQKMKDVAAAQAAAMRMRISTEMKIRRVLTVEQRTLLRSLREEARERQRERFELRDERQQRRANRPNMRNQRDGLAPLVPGRDVQRPTRP